MPGVGNSSDYNPVLAMGRKTSGDNEDLPM